MRIKILLTVSLIFALFLNAKAQSSLQVTSDTTYFTGPPGILMIGHARVTNVGSGTISVKVRREENNVQVSDTSYFCYGPNCYPWNTSVSATSSLLNPSDFDTTMKAYLNPGPVGGTSTVKYCFYDQDTPSDSACITFTYHVSTVGINDLNSLKFLSNPYPNPADAYARLAYTISGGKDCHLVISNVLGAIVKDIKVNDKNSTLVIPTAELNSGVYFCSMMIDGKNTGSKKLVVNHR